MQFVTPFVSPSACVFAVVLVELMTLLLLFRSTHYPEALGTPRHSLFGCAPFIPCGEAYSLAFSSTACRGIRPTTPRLLRGMLPLKACQTLLSASPWEVLLRLFCDCGSNARTHTHTHGRSTVLGKGNDRFLHPYFTAKKETKT